jgi:ABC-2 type transport system permease protein
MFSHILSVFRYELVRNLSRRAFLLTTFGLPLLGVTVFLVTQIASSGGDDNGVESPELEFELEGIQVAGYVDESGFFESPGELAADVMIPFDSQDAAEDALDSGEIDVYYIIPEDYLELGDITLYLPGLTLTQLNDAPVRQLYFSQLLEQGVSEETLVRLLNPAQIESEVLQTETEEAEPDELDSNREMVVIVFALILIFSFFSTSTYLMQTVIEEKESYLIEILISSVSSVELLAGKILALGALGLFQVVIYVGTFVGVAAFGTDLTGPFANITIPVDLLVVAIVYYILGYLLFAALFGMVGAVSASLTEGPSISTIFVIPSVLPWIFWALYTEDPLNPIVTILSFVPLTSPLGMVMRSAVTEVSFIEYVISVTLLIATVAFVMWMAGRLFRVQTLLSGKFPKLTQIPKLIFGNE